MVMFLLLLITAVVVVVAVAVINNSGGSFDSIVTLIMGMATFQVRLVLLTDRYRNLQWRKNIYKTRFTVSALKQDPYPETVEKNANFNVKT